jgi:hypothetical protein
MTKKNAFYEALLPSGRGVRFLKPDTRMALAITAEVNLENERAFVGEFAKATAVRCLIGITRKRIPVAATTREPTEEEIATAKKAKKKLPENVSTIDVDATLNKVSPANADPWNEHWIRLTHEMLMNDIDDNEFSLLSVLADPLDWEAFHNYVGTFSLVGPRSSPFAGKSRTRSG